MKKLVFSPDLKAASKTVIPGEFTFFIKIKSTFRCCIAMNYVSLQFRITL
jgi:hypothetical protein